MIKAVIFDFDQTLVNSAESFRLAEKDAETRIYSDLGLTSWSDFLSDYRKFRGEFHAAANFSRRSLWGAVFLHYGHEPPEGFLAELETEYWDTVRSKTRLYPETKTVLQRLKSTYRLGLVTNTQGQDNLKGHRLSQFPEINSYFEAIVVAGESGVSPKPNRKPFLLCMEILGISPSEAIFVGDDFQIDKLGADGVGLKPVLLKHYSVDINWPQVETSVPVINSLDELVPLIEKKTTTIAAALRSSECGGILLFRLFT